jgi:LPS sulfotransferase NodH
MSVIKNGTAYLVCGTPRTGSSLLCSLLSSTGIAGHPESYFRKPDERTWADRWEIPRRTDGSFDYQDYIRAAIAAGSTANGVFGGRVMWGTMDGIVENVRTLHPNLAGRDLDLLTATFGLLRFVHLWRSNTLAQAVSWARAEQTTYWHGGDVTTSEPHFGLAQIGDLTETIDEHNTAWRDWFSASGVEPHQVIYEEMITDKVGVAGGVLSFLGLDPSAGRPIASGHQRQADELNADWIARYRAATNS